jgi:hypothetical protein
MEDSVKSRFESLEEQNVKRDERMNKKFDELKNLIMMVLMKIEQKEERIIDKTFVLSDNEFDAKQVNVEKETIAVNNQPVVVTTQQMEFVQDSVSTDNDSGSKKGINLITTKAQCKQEETIDPRMHLDFSTQEHVYELREDFSNVFPSLMNMFTKFKKKARKNFQRSAGARFKKLLNGQSMSLIDATMIFSDMSISVRWIYDPGGYSVDDLISLVATKWLYLGPK